ncbi:MAG TPA: 16S rRNA (guanine(527)-N(7))-methyltransferase RsmG [Terriglobia bacterium]|nr:16S rRNA (guanine(527)-N(7))-methyltransferase RsmG [Terriglobia bacterium]
MLSEVQIHGLLQPFGITLSQPQIGNLIVYLNLLLRWNEKINLTAIRRPEECVTRHFGESLLLARHEQLAGRLLDIGSGAGFPALALKLVFPELEITLLEPVAKKRAFLKEVVRACAFSGVEVRGERIQGLKKGTLYDTITMRAVGSSLIKEAVSYLKPSGKFYLWLSQTQAQELVKLDSGMKWDVPIEIPESRERIILPGSLKG